MSAMLSYRTAGDILISTVKRLFELFVHFLDVCCSFIWLLTSNHILVIIEVYVCLKSSCKSLIKAALSSCQMLSILELEYHHILNVFKSSIFQSGRKTGYHLQLLVFRPFWIFSFFPHKLYCLCFSEVSPLYSFLSHFLATALIPFRTLLPHPFSGLVKWSPNWSPIYGFSMLV